jgi:hypothetical protein
LREPSATGQRALEGRGVGLVREIALAGRVQRGLERLYRLEGMASVDDFMTHAEDGEREALHLREAEDGALEISLRVPKLEAGLDAICQIIEGVSHFVYLADRAARERETTQLELELQAEVDKYVVLAASMPSFDEDESRRLRARLYEHVRFVHTAESEEGERYRLANDYAQRFTRRLEREFVMRARYAEMRTELRRFFQLGQGEKLRAA